MTYKPICKDLVSERQKCNFCPHLLTSMKAYVLVNESNGEIVYAGPTCSKNNIAKDYSLKGLPDYTKFTEIPEGNKKASGESHGGGKHNNGSSHVVNDDLKIRAIEYLVLRVQKLRGELGEKSVHPALQLYYDSYIETGDLNQRAVNHINNIEKKINDSMSLVTLQRMYNHLFCIDVALEKIESHKRDYLIKLRDYLKQHHRLTQLQIDGANKWIAPLKNVALLK